MWHKLPETFLSFSLYFVSIYTFKLIEMINLKASWAAGKHCCQTLRICFFAAEFVLEELILYLDVCLHT